MFGLLSLQSFVLFFLFAIGLGMILSVSSLLLEELSFHTYPKMRHIIVLFVASLLENLGYRQLNVLWRLEGLVRWLIGKKPGWGRMTRTAAWQSETPSEQIGEQELAK